MIKLFCKHKKFKINKAYEYLDPNYTSTNRDLRAKCECLDCGKNFECKIECDAFSNALEETELKLYEAYTNLNLEKYKEAFKNLAGIEEETNE